MNRAGEDPLSAAAALAARAAGELEAHAGQPGPGPGALMTSAAAVRDMAASLSGSLSSAALLTTVPQGPGRAGLAEAAGHAATAADAAGRAWQELARHLGPPAAGRQQAERTSPRPGASAVQAASALEAALARAACGEPRAGQVPAQLTEILVRLARTCGYLGQPAARREGAAAHLDRAAFHLRAAAVAVAAVVADGPSGAGRAPGNPTEES